MLADQVYKVLHKVADTARGFMTGKQSWNRGVPSMPTFEKESVTQLMRGVQALNPKPQAYSAALEDMEAREASCTGSSLQHVQFLGFLGRYSAGFRVSESLFHCPQHSLIVT